MFYLNTLYNKDALIKYVWEISRYYFYGIQTVLNITLFSSGNCITNMAVFEVWFVVLVSFYRLCCCRPHGPVSLAIRICLKPPMSCHLCSFGFTLIAHIVTSICLEEWYFAIWEWKSWKVKPLASSTIKIMQNRKTLLLEHYVLMILVFHLLTTLSHYAIIVWLVEIHAY